MIILTGGAGFIGSAFLQKLNDNGHHEIVVVDSLGSSEKWKNLRGKHFLDYFHKDQFLKLIQEDRFPSPVDAIVHLGACSSTTEENAEYMIQNNYCYSRTLAEWALKKEIRFIYASSAATYGDGSLGFSDHDEVSLTLQPLNVYALSKQLFDIWTLRTGAMLKILGVKFFNVYGPNEYHKKDMRSVIHKSFHQIQETGKVKLFKSHRPDYKDGEQKRDFIYVKDCAEVLYWFLENPRVCGICNLGTGKARSWNDLVKAVFSAMKRKPEIEYIDMPESIRDKYQYFTEADMSSLQSTGCPIQSQSLEDGVTDYVQNYLMKEDQCL